MAIDPGALGGCVAGIGALGWMVYKSIIERRKTRKHGLATNPERCANHEGRLAVIDQRLKRIEKDIEEIKDKL